MPNEGAIRKWDPENMRNIEIGIKLTVKTFNVPRTTLHTMARSESKVTHLLSTPLRRKAVFSAELERQLVKYAIEMEYRNWGLSPKVEVFADVPPNADIQCILL